MNASLVNSSDGMCNDTLHAKLNPIFRLYVHPGIYLIGIPGNLLSLWIWLQKEMRNSTSRYFSALALSDTVVLCLHLILTVQEGVGRNILQFRGWCESFNGLYLAMETLSGLLILGLTVDRFIIVNYPMRRFKIHATSRALKTISALVLISILVGVMEGLVWSYNKRSGSCVIHSLLKRDTTGDFLKTWNMTLLCLAILLPMLVIIALNVTIARSLLVVSQRRKEMLQEEESSQQLEAVRQQVLPHGNHSPTRLHKSDMDGTIILLCLSMYLVLSECPDSIVYLIRPFFLPSRRGVLAYCNYCTVAICLETFSLTNYAFNVLIYSLAGKRFRACVKRRLIPLHVFQHRRTDG